MTIPASIHEGDSVTLSASDSSGQSNVTYAWDLNGDGIFSDATGASITLTWAQLEQFGINLGASGTPLSYPIAVKATTTQNAVQFGGQVIQLSAGAAGVLKVYSAAPTLASIPISATLGTPFTIPLMATYYGTEKPQAWTVNWGDGTTDPLGGDATSASHTFTSLGSFSVTVTDVDVNASTSASGSVTVTPASQSLSISSSSLSFPAGAALVATASTSGSPIRYLWTLTTPTGAALGTVTTTTPTLTQTWTQLNALGINDIGSFLLRVTATYQDRATPPNSYTATSPAVTFAVTDAAPTATLLLSSPTVPQSSPAGSITATVTNYQAAASSDTAGTATVAFDFNSDGKFDLTGQPIGTAVNIPASFLTTAGTQVARAVITDANGSLATLYATFAVTAVSGGSNPVVPPNPVLPTLSLAPVAAVNQGSPASVTIQNSGGNVPVSSYLIAWGDNTFDNITANGQSSQTFTHSYAHAAPGGSTYTIGVTGLTIAGDDPAPTAMPLTTSVMVNNVAPIVALTTGNSTVVQGDVKPLTVSWTVNQPAGDSVAQEVVDWGDGTTNAYTGDVTSAAAHLHLCPR